MDWRRWVRATSVWAVRNGNRRSGRLKNRWADTFKRVARQWSRATKKRTESSSDNIRKVKVTNSADTCRKWLHHCIEWCKYQHTRPKWNYTCSKFQCDISRHKPHLAIKRLRPPWFHYDAVACFRLIRVIYLFIFSIGGFSYGSDGSGFL
jgi:hypothetical protein